MLVSPRSALGLRVEIATWGLCMHLGSFKSCPDSTGEGQGGGEEGGKEDHIFSLPLLDRIFLERHYLCTLSTLAGEEVAGVLAVASASQIGMGPFLA